jgi:CRP-like cAMP-binding protein
MNIPADSSFDPTMNDLLAAIPRAEWFRFSKSADLVQLTQGKVLCDAGVRSEYVFFPTTAIVSLVHTTRDGHCTEVAVVGSDGVVGVSAFMGGSAAGAQAVVQTRGQAFRMPSRIVKQESDSGGTILKVLLRYMHALMTQLAQNAVCNRHHTIDQQLCRRLLCSLDRLPAQDIDMTQEVIANLLGVRREGITAAALKLQRTGAIRYNRGHIEVLDRNELERRACECYAVTKREYRRLDTMPSIMRIAA